MDYEIKGNKLIIRVDEDEREELQEIRLELGDEFGTDGTMFDAFEALIANSELDWVHGCTDDVTDAPMLGIFSEELRAADMTRESVAQNAHGARQSGRWDGEDWYVLVLQRWAYMDYQVRSPLDDLADDGEVVFIS